MGGYLCVCVIFFTRPYGSMEGYLVYCVFVCLFICTVSDFSAAERAGAWNFACLLAYYPDRSSPLFGKDWLAGSHGGGISSGWTSELAARLSIVRKSSGEFDISSAGTCGEAQWAVGIGAAALLKAVWWGMRLASLLTHLFFCLFVCLYGYGFLHGRKS